MTKLSNIFYVRFVKSKFQIQTKLLLEIRSSHVIQLNLNFFTVSGSKLTMISNRSKTVHLIN